MTVFLALLLTLLNAVSTRAARVVLALYALSLGAQPVTVGVLAAAFSAVPMVLSWQAGRLADRFGSRWLLIVGAAGGGLGMLVPYFVAGLHAVFIAAALIGASSAIYVVSLQNLVGVLSSTHDRARNFSNFSLMMSVANFIGPLLAGFSIDHWGHAVSCLCLALLTLVPLALLSAKRQDIPGGTRKVEHASGGLRDMLAHRGIRRTLATSSLMHTGQDLFQFYIPVYAHGIGLSASVIGIVLAMNSAAAFVVRLVIPRLMTRWSEERLLAQSFYVGGASLLLIPFFENGWVLALIAFIFGLGMGCGGPLITILMFSHSSDGRSGEALGLRMTVNHLSRVIGPVVFGSIGSAFGLPTVFWLNGLMLGGGGWLSRSDRATSDEELAPGQDESRAGGHGNRPDRKD
jgi:MFS family permease